MKETVEILRMAYGRGAVAKLGNGKTVFVKGGIPGEMCEIEIFEDHERFAVARIVSRAVRADEIPGADWADLSYKLQLVYKKSVVRDALVRNGRFDEGFVDSVLQDVVASENEWNYRNKIELAWISGRLGMMDEGTNNFVTVKSFPLASKAIEKSPGALAGSLKFALHGDECGLFRVGIRHSERTGDVQVALWTTPGWFPRHEVSRVVQDAVGATSVVRIIAEGGMARRIKQVEVLSGDPLWREYLSAIKYGVSAPSFFQVNTNQAEVLQRLVIKAIEQDIDLKKSNGTQASYTESGSSLGEHSTSCFESSSNEVKASRVGEAHIFCGDVKDAKSPHSIRRIADFYCGCGTFTLPLVKAGFDVVGVELAGSSTRDLKKNLDSNRLSAKVICDDVRFALKKMSDFDACVVDPPKSGLDKEVVNMLIKREPKKIVYVSCDPMTLARDLKRFCEAGYSVNEVTPVDMFPQTHHVETVVSMTR